MDILALSKLGRFRDIVGVLFKYGFDDVAERLQLPGKILISKTRIAVPEMNSSANCCCVPTAICIASA